MLQKMTVNDMLTKDVNLENVLDIVNVHCEGEIGRVVTSGIPDFPGSNMRDKLLYLQNEGDSFRKYCIHEPRGFLQMTTNLLLPAVEESAHAAFIPMQPDGAHAMSGSNAICVATTILETGMVPMQEPETEVILDTAAGLVKAKAKCADGKVTSVSLEFVPSFAEHLNAPLEVEGIGTLNVDVAFGGVYFVVPDVNDIGLKIQPDQAQDLIEAGQRIVDAAREQLPVQHPEIPEFNVIDNTLFADRIEGETPYLVNGTVMSPGRMDRSPCGTGSAARLALLTAKGQIEVGEEMQMRSIINSKFQIKVLRKTMVGEREAVVSQISGRAWLYGRSQLGTHPTDPYRGGYTLADTWTNGLTHEIPAS